VFTISRLPEGCGEADQVSREGTYYATIVNGKWTSQRITKRLGPSSLVLDPRTGRVHFLIENVVHTRNANGTWVSTRLPAGIEFPVMRLDPATGNLLVVYVQSTPDGESDNLFAITSP
jgi:hypothetical protein